MYLLRGLWLGFKNLFNRGRDFRRRFGIGDISSNLGNIGFESREYLKKVISLIGGLFIILA